MANEPPSTVLSPSASSSLAPPSELLDKTNQNVYFPLKMTSIWESSTAAREQGIHSDWEMGPFQQVSRITTLLWQLVSFYTRPGWLVSFCLCPREPESLHSFSKQVLSTHHMPDTVSLGRSKHKAILLTSKTLCAGKLTLKKFLVLIL